MRSNLFQLGMSIVTGVVCVCMLGCETSSVPRVDPTPVREVEVDAEPDKKTDVDVQIGGGEGVKVDVDSRKE